MLVAEYPNVNEIMRRTVTIIFISSCSLSCVPRMLTLQVARQREIPENTDAWQKSGARGPRDASLPMGHNPVNLDALVTSVLAHEVSCVSSRLQHQGAVSGNGAVAQGPR